jgi:DNA topoisomerase-1
VSTVARKTNSSEKKVTSRGSETGRNAPKKASKASGASRPKAAKSDSKAAKVDSHASKNARASGRSLVIVESPKKAKSINQFLGTRFVVKASMGHVRDLPERGSDLGIDVEKGYLPKYVVPDRKKSTIDDLKREASRAELVYLATDPDREGEAIAWHLQQALGLGDERVRRVMFHEITERAVKDAFDHVGPIDMNKVNAQQARRFLDRFVGYKLSPLLWTKVARNLSAGRVQSVAVRLIAEREKEILAFRPEEYWKITATLRPAGNQEETATFKAELAEWRGKAFEASNETDAKAIHGALEKAAYRVSRVEAIEKQDRAEPPFKTSTLQQQASIRLRFSGKKAMKIAQELYEGVDVGGDGPVGLITYMRTDSLRVSDEAITSVRDMIGAKYGPDYLPAKPLRYAAGKMAQEAHEAIRPTDLALDPEAIKGRLSHDQYRLYQLIYRRFVASQMTPARFEVTNVEIAAADGLFKAQGKILRFDGYRRVLPPAGKQEDSLLPALEVDKALDLLALDPTQHFTQPPPRYSEATLVKALEKENIGRPSTYAPIIQTIQDRGYVEQKERRFFATPLGLHVTDKLVKHFPQIMDLKFTAHMEDELDDIVTGKEEMHKVLDEFYYPFESLLEKAKEEMEREPILVPEEKCPECSSEMHLRFSKKGNRPFYSCSRYPDCKGTKRPDGTGGTPTVATETDCPECKAHKLVIRTNRRGKPFYSCSGYPTCKFACDVGPNGELVIPPKPSESDHPCPKCGKPMAVKQGPRGPFLGCTGYPKCRQTMQIDAEGKPIRPISVDVACVKCGGPMGVKFGPRGAFLGCLNYPKCRSTAPIPDELKEQVAAHRAATSAAASNGVDLKSITVDEACEQCGAPMTVRRGRRGYFLGCSNYPKCKGTREPGDATKERIATAMAGA